MRNILLDTLAAVLGLILALLSTIKSVTKTAISGALLYTPVYLFYSLILYIGILLLNIPWEVRFWQCLGAVIVLRALQNLIITPADAHLKKDS